ncbi:molybdopterin oxidoreductase Fe4S4 region [Klebsiella pneumoniae]|uniref:Molybdopterin oxidoreductase Fe4S4 region n=1 Tax=Klebsiella pneumoniae TaxID=573 RepID=A0A3S4K862_KLEPN|nr:molybdopterin oxidoreductase Fe4S4 region [Klebsiella pneumoniae]
MDVSRRKFFKTLRRRYGRNYRRRPGLCPKMALAQARNFKLLRAKEIRNTLHLLLRGLRLLMYSLGDGAKNAKEAIYHIEGDPDHPVSRGALCPKGGRPAGLCPQRKPSALSAIPRPGLG